MRVAALTGDDVLDALDPEQTVLETGEPLRSIGALFSANAYLGVEAMLPALESGADMVLTGRVADPSLALAPLAHHFGWTLDDAERFARGTVVGHLLECAGQLTGGYYADPGRKDVPGMATLGFPFADVDADGNATLSKVAGTGGIINRMTATEQLLYEVTDPAAYLTPDVTADFSNVEISETAPDTIAVKGARGTQAARHAEGERRLSRRLYRRRRNLLCGRELRRARASSAARSCAERLRGQFQEMRVDMIGMSVAAHAADVGRRLPALRGAPARRGPLGRPGEGRADRRRGRGAVHQRPGGRRRRAQGDARADRHRVVPARARQGEAAGRRCSET